MYKNHRLGNAKKESPESHWSSGSSTAATLTATVSDDIVHDGDDGDENYNDNDEKVKMMMATLMIVMNKKPDNCIHPLEHWAQGVDPSACWAPSALPSVPPDDHHNYDDAMINDHQIQPS